MSRVPVTALKQPPAPAAEHLVENVGTGATGIV
jgi:hypothetical protein